MMSVDGARVARPLFQEEDGGASPTLRSNFGFGQIDLRKALVLNEAMALAAPAA